MAQRTHSHPVHRRCLLLCPHLALTATESDGTPLMEQYVPCPVCETSWAQRADPNEKSESVQYFDMEDCVLTAIERDFISCPRHPDLPVPLQELVPELFMTDFPARCAPPPLPGQECRQCASPANSPHGTLTMGCRDRPASPR